MFGRQKVATLVAEFFGTGILTFLILSVQRSTIGVPFFVAAGAGLALAVTTYVLHETSGAHFNPALTIGLWTARRISTLLAAAYIIVQLLGGYLAGRLYIYFSGTHLQSVGGHYSAKILIAEGVGTIIFTMAVASTIYKRFSIEGVAAFTGIAYMVGIVAASAGNAALGLLNPAVALGIHAWVWGTYVLGPILGAIIGVNLYTLLFANSDVQSEALGTNWPKLNFASVTTVTEVTKPSAKKKSTAKKKR